MLFVFVAVSAGLWNETKNHQCSHHCSCRAQLAQNRCNFVIWLTRTNRFQLLWRLAWLHSPYAWNDQPMDVWKGSIYPRMHMRTNAMIDPQQLERRPNCVVGLSSQCCSRHAGKNGLLCAVLLLGSLAHLVSMSCCIWNAEAAVKNRVSDCSERLHSGRQETRRENPGTTGAAGLYKNGG